MFFTQILLRYRNKWRPRPFPKGNMWRGKYRCVRFVTNLDLAKVRDDLAIEEKNMFYLRHPFMNASDGKLLMKEYFRPFRNHIIEYRKEKYEKFSRYNDNRSLEKHVKQTLLNSDSWE